MPRRTASLALVGLGLAGLGLYSARRSLLARALGLRPPEYGMAVVREIPTPMPDGVTLYADRYYPSGAGPFPTILLRTPYGRASELSLLGLFHDSLARLFVERGYNLVVQGVRGRFRSEGIFEPFVNEAADGRATLDWIAAQPWFDGNLGMWGPSYLGYTQWAVAADAPPFLKALVPIVTTARFSRSFYPEGAFSVESSLRWASLVHALGAEQSLSLAALTRLLPHRREATIRAALAHRPVAEADALAVGAPVEFYRRWFSEIDPGGEYWRRVDHHHNLGRVEVPVHLVAGWYDIFLDHQLSDYATLLAAGHTPYLTVLPYAHMDNRLTFNSVREGLWWFDAHLKGHRELLQRRPVRVYLMGAHEWHEMDFWPPPARVTRYYLHADQLLSPAAPAAHSSPDQYRYNPDDPTPAVGGPVLSQYAGPRDQTPVEARSDLISYTTPPLDADVDVIGHVRLELFVRSTQAHTDFVGRLCHVAPDGHSVNVCDGIFRVEPGKGEPQPDGSLRIEVDMWATARRFPRGHRIRLQICSAAYPRISINLGDGGPLGRGIHGRPADQTIYHDTAHPSALVVPIVTEASREEMRHTHYQPAGARTSEGA